MSGSTHDVPDDTGRALPLRVILPKWAYSEGNGIWQRSRCMQRQQKITLGEMRSQRRPSPLIVYCSDLQCW